MSLERGARLGPYEIVTLAGTGGMGEVYQARDTRLDRTVAIKVLPPSLALDRDARERFEREARNISALNHPNICTLHDVGHANGTDYLVMEFVEGQTLEERLGRGAMSGEDTLAIARQIVDALDAAHERGIIHRDLKPANIRITRDGQVKVLDFGLAKALSPQPAAATATATALGATQAGTVLGTPAYMSPEQARGEGSDRRTDVWAFGCVVYEMMAGRQTFAGPSLADTLAAVLTTTPDWNALPAQTPSGVRRLLARCLERDMKRRLRDIGDARPYLEESPAEPASISTARSARSRHARPLFVTIGAVALLLLGGIAGWILKKVPATPRMASSSPLPNGQLMTRDGRRAIDISPDGTRIAYIADGRIYLQYLHNFEVHPIPGSELVDPIDLAFSSDGQSLVFYASRGRRGIRTIPVIGGPGEEIVSLETPTFGIRWQDDSILFSTRVRIQRHDVRSGQLDTLFEAAQDEEVGHPQLIDGGRRLLYTVRPGTARWNDASIVVQSVTGGERQVLVRGGTSGRLLSNDVLLYRRDATLYAQRIDRRSLQPEGKAVEVLASVVPADTTGGSHFGVSDNGTLVFFQGLGPTEFVPVWVDRKGQEETLKTGPRRYCGARISPNGKRIAFEVCGDNQDIMVWDTAARTFEALTSRSETDSNPIWYDDDSIIYRSNPGNHGVFDLYQRKVHSALAPVSIVHQPGVEGALDVSVGGKWLLFREGTGEANGTLKLISLAAGATPVAMADQAHNQVNADISPDDRWIAYETDEDGTPEIWIRPLQRGSDVRWKVSQAGGRYPVWATAHELIYVQDGRHVTVVTVPDLPPGAEFQSAATFRLPFDASRYLLGNNNRWFDVSRHDGRFLMLKIENSPRIAFITGWLDELTARIAAR